MLVLSRKVGESIKVADDIEITVLAVDNQRVRLGIRAPRHIQVRRGPSVEEVGAANREAAVQGAATPSLLSQAASAKKQQE